MQSMHMQMMPMQPMQPMQQPMPVYGHQAYVPPVMAEPGATKPGGFCSQCGSQKGAGAFCDNCGAKQ